MLSFKNTSITENILLGARLIDKSLYNLNLNIKTMKKKTLKYKTIYKLKLVGV